MKIKLTESQLINTLKKSYSLNEDSGALEDFLTTWAKIRKDAEAGSNKTISDLIFKNLIMNPKLDLDNLSLEDMEKIDLWPVNDARITSGFGYRTIGGESGNHQGVDLAVESGTKVFSPANGKVVSSMNAGGKCGGLVIIDHGNFQTKYCHLSKFDVVKKGDEVKKGQLIGYSGGGKNDPFKGNSLGPHLHYEVSRNGRVVDPETIHTKLS